MRTLKYKVQGQNIIRDSGCDFSHIIKDSNNYIRLVFEWDEQWKNKAKVISLRNANGEEVNVVLQSKIVLQEKITNGSMFSFQIYGKEGEEKIHTNREYIEQE